MAKGKREKPEAKALRKASRPASVRQVEVDAASRALAPTSGARPRTRGEGPYDAAGNGRRLRGWHFSDSGATTLAVHNIPALRARSRDMARKSPFLISGARALETACAPLTLQYKGPLELREKVEWLWELWTGFSDANGLINFYSQQSQALRSVIIDGEVFIRLRGRRPEDGLPVPVQAQLLEADFVPVEKNEQLPNGGYILAGIEFDAIGRRVAYHMYRQHPGETMLGGGSLETTRVPAEEVLHVMDPLRPGQVRGTPWAAPALLKIREWMEYDEAELVRKKAAAHHVGFITSPSPDGLMGEDEEDEEADLGEAVAKMEPGSMIKLLPGEEVTFSQPIDLGGQYAEFARQQLRAVAAALGVTYEQLSGDYSQVNYSSARLAHHQFTRRVRAVQELLSHQMCGPLFRRWFSDAVLSGVIAAEGFASRSFEFLAAEWCPPKLPVVDPGREIAAEIAAVRAGFKSRSQVIIEMGGDPDLLDKQLAADKSRADHHGLVLDTDPAAVTAQGMFQPERVAPLDDDEQGKDGSRTIPGDGTMRYVGGHIERIHGGE